MVGREFNDSVVDGLFAATPPLEALRVLLSWAATVDDASLDTVDKKSKLHTFVWSFQKRRSKEKETTSNTVGKLLASLYGTRGTSANWQEEMLRCMRE